MRKHYLLGDIHLKRTDPLGIINAEGVNTRLLDKLNIIETIALEASRNKANKVILLGDVFDSVNPPERLKKAFWRAIYPVIESNIELVIILGNHDITGQIYNFASDEVILNKNIKIISKITVLDDCICVPYLPKEEILKESAVFNKNLPIYGHIEVEGVELGVDNSPLTQAVPVNIFPTTVPIVLGHIHKFQKLTNNITYLGSCIQADFGEANLNKWAYTIEYKSERTVVHTMIEIPQRPMYNVIIKEGTESEKILTTNEVPKEYLENGVLLKFNFEGSKEWVNSINKVMFKKRFPNAMRVSFSKTYLDVGRKEINLTSNMDERVINYTKEKNKGESYQELGLSIAAMVREVEL